MTDSTQKTIATTAEKTAKGGFWNSKEVDELNIFMYKKLESMKGRSEYDWKGFGFELSSAKVSYRIKTEFWKRFFDECPYEDVKKDVAQKVMLRSIAFECQHRHSLKKLDDRLNTNEAVDDAMARAIWMGMRCGQNLQYLIGGVWRPARKMFFGEFDKEGNKKFTLLEKVEKLATANFYRMKKRGISPRNPKSIEREAMQFVGFTATDGEDGKSVLYERGNIKTRRFYRDTPAKKQVAQFQQKVETPTAMADAMTAAAE